MAEKEKIHDLITGLLLSSGVLANIDNYISLILAVLGLIYGGLRIYGATLDNRLKKRKLDKDESDK